MRVRQGIFLCAVLMVCLCHGAGGQEGDGFWPDSVKVDPSSKELLPGEKLTIRLTDFKDEAGNLPKPEMKIIVQPKYGDIINGENPNSGQLTGKEFAVGLGTIDVVYRAPSDSNTDSDTITISSVNFVPPEELGQDPDEYLDLIPITKIAQVDITIRHYNFARAVLHDYYHYDDGYQSGTTEVEVNVGIIYDHLAGPYYMVKSVRILGFKGSDTYHSKTENKKAVLTAAEATHYAPQVVFHSEKGRIEAVSIPLVHVELSWTGDTDIGPPDSIDIEPITEYDSSAEEAAMEEASKKMKADNEGRQDKMPDLSAVGDVMRASLRLLWHPDFRVTNRMSENYLCGEAHREDSDETSIHKKRFTWEVHSKPR